MRAHAQTATLETFGVQAATDFTIKANGKAFRILIDGLYSDKVQSITRELCTNAFDSMKAAGSDQPFYVHCPDDNRAEFYVRDYGVGMDHEKVTRLYTTLFASDKDDSDDLVGMLGLGSKSPFAATDQFFIHCYDGPVEETGSMPGRPGTVRNYLAAIGPDGVPQLLFHGEAESSEPTGVKVGFAVQPSEHAAYRRAIKIVSFGFNPVFEANCEVASFASIADPPLKGHGWSAFTDAEFPAASLGYNARWFVRQGCVIYPVASRDDLPLPTCTRFRYLMDMPIGSVGVTGSREAVEYTPRTVEAIKARIELVKAQAEALIRAKLEGIPTISSHVAAVAKLSPSWLKAAFVHAPSGLSEASYKFKGVAGFFTATHDETANRWSYDLRQHASFSDTTANHYVLIAGFEALLDEHREEGSSEMLSAVERRRIARLCRFYCQNKGVSSVSFGLGVDWTPEFWAATLPRATYETITVDDLRRAVPKRERRTADETTEAPLIRGLALARAQGEQTPLTELPTIGKHAAWVAAEDWRRRGGHIWRAAKRMGVKQLFVASVTAQPLIDDAGVPMILDFTHNWLRRHGLKEDQFRALFSVDYYTRPLLCAARSAWAYDQNVYTRVTRNTGLLSQAFRDLKPFARFEVEALDDKPLDTADVDAFGAVLVNDPDKPAKVDQTIKTLSLLVNGNQSHPVYKVISLFTDSRMPKDAALGLIEVILVAQRQFKVYGEPKSRAY